MADGTVLVVDDDAVILKLLEVNFQLEGYEVMAAADGAEALARAELNVPDVVVLDVMMPGIDGLEVARRLRANLRTAHVPILLLSAKAQVADIDAGRELANDYVTKPFDAMDLLDRVDLLLVQRRAESLPAESLPAESLPAESLPGGSATAGSATAGSATAGLATAGLATAEPEPSATPPSET